MLGIIGGSGVYNIEGLENTRWVKAESTFGEPSDEVQVGQPVLLTAEEFKAAQARFAGYGKLGCTKQ